MTTSPPVGRNTNPTCDPIRELLTRKSIYERLRPVLAEMIAAIQGESQRGGREKALPAYCYSIFQILRKTYFKVLPEPDRCILRGPDQTDWRAVGKMIGAGLSCLSPAASKLKNAIQQASLPPEDGAQLRAMMDGIPWETGANALWDAFLNTSKAAQQCGLTAFSELTLGFRLGHDGFIDQNGECLGATERANVYWFLLLVWAEVQEMQNQSPSISRADFHRWLNPFARYGAVNIPDLAYLSDICDEIGLKFKTPGPPRKK